MGGESCASRGRSPKRVSRKRDDTFEGDEGPSRLQPTSTEPTDFSRWWLSLNFGVLLWTLVADSLEISSCSPAVESELRGFTLDLGGRLP
jgi:hypothetical protein